MSALTEETVVLEIINIQTDELNGRRGIVAEVQRITTDLDSSGSLLEF